MQRRTPAAALATALFLALPALAQEGAPASPAPVRGEITVRGEGRVAAAPDLARVTLGVQSFGATAAEAMAENTSATAQVFEQLAAAGIEARDMQTSELSLGPRWEHPDGAAPRVAGFEASNLVQVTVRDLSTLGAVLDAVVQTGANTFRNLAFDLADPRPARDEARRAAVADAIARAELYAGAAGVTLGPMLSLSENGATARPMMRMAMADSASVPIAGGELGIEAEVTVVFATGD